MSAAFEDRERFAYSISAALADNPDWLTSAISAIANGMSQALRRADERAGKADFAMRTALLLAGPDRVTPASKEIFERALLQYLEDTKGNSLAEDKMRDKLKKAAR